PRSMSRSRGCFPCSEWSEKQTHTAKAQRSAKVREELLLQKQTSRTFASFASSRCDFAFVVDRAWMDARALKEFLEAVRAGKVSVDEAVRRIADLPVQHVADFAQLDGERAL